MPADSLEGMFTDFVVQNAARIGRALAHQMRASLTGNIPGGATSPEDVSVDGESLAPASSSATRALPPKGRMSKRPGSAKANNEKILAAITKEGSSLQDIVDKTELPKKYVRSRLNRLIRDEASVRTQGKTTKTRYFRA